MKGWINIFFLKLWSKPKDQIKKSKRKVRVDIWSGIARGVRSENLCGQRETLPLLEQVLHFSFSAHNHCPAQLTRIPPRPPTLNIYIELKTRQMLFSVALLLAPVLASSKDVGVFISEIIEGSSYNRVRIKHLCPPTLSPWYEARDLHCEQKG